MKIAAVIVTFNRLSDLKIAIQKYEEQIFMPSCMIIVNNCSTDGTYEFLEQWKKKSTSFEKIVLHLPQNIGGSGGFTEGIKYALQTDCDWYWIADDDAFLAEDALEKLTLFEHNQPELIRNCAALCGAVVRNPQSIEIDVWHRRKLTTRFGVPKQSAVSMEEYEKAYMKINLFTFVGAMVKAEVVKEVGLPRGDFFIYYDDLEFAYRVGKKGDIYCIPECKVFHDTAKHEDEYGANWRSYYQSRNSLIFCKLHFPVAYYRTLIKRIIQRLILKCIGKYSMANQLDWDAMCDARKDKTGISEKYYIGWKRF